MVNCRTDDQGPAPPAFQALTLQKYVVPKPSEERGDDVPVMPLWSMTVARNDDEVETCTWFDVAVGEAVHCICVVTATPVELSAGSPTPVLRGVEYHGRSHQTRLECANVGRSSRKRTIDRST